MLSSGSKKFSFHLGLVESLRGVPGRVSVQGLCGSFPAFLVALIATEMPYPIVAIAPSGEEAQRFDRDLKLFLTLLNSADLHAPFLFPSLESPGFTFALSDRTEQGIQAAGLATLLFGKAPITVVSASTLMRRVLPREELADYCHEIKVGAEIGRDTLAAELAAGGYTRVSLVEDSGEFTLRGGIIDFFCPARDNPVRVEFYGDTIESIREFDGATQRSLKRLESLHLVPAGLVLMAEQHLSRALAGVRGIGMEAGITKSSLRPIEERIRQGTYFPGASDLLPLFYERSESFLDYLPSNALVVILNPEGLRRSLNSFWETRLATYKRGVEAGELVLPPQVTDTLPDNMMVHLCGFRSLLIEPFGSGMELGVRSNVDLKGTLQQGFRDKGLISSIAPYFRDLVAQGYRVALASGSRYAADRLRELLAEAGLVARLVCPEGPDRGLGGVALPFLSPLEIWVADVTAGFQLECEGVALITEEEIFGEKRRLRERRPFKGEPFLGGLRDLRLHDYVVHADHGIGVYRGLQTLTFDGIANDYLLLEYYGGDKLYLPVERINLVSRYLGSDDAPPRLDQLGGSAWARVKQRVRASLKQVAQELVRLYAQRQVLTGYSFTGRDHYLNEFEATFEFEETPDQLVAVEDVLKDMQAERPMDRLICGDVGFGKTEVAVRAAFKAVMDGKQAAVLVPTTVLAEQHFQTFSKRLLQYPVRVEVLSRFKGRAAQRQIIQGMKDGNVDIVIGTHRLLQKDVAFKELGLLVVDEEHRFGVNHKEKIKKMKELVDVLTLSATPIPRTLYFSLAGMRDLSLIETPPADRLAIKTYILKFDEGIIVEGIRDELSRDGQIFFVHNRVQSIDQMARYVQKLVPEARVGVAHGQMEEADLEQVMVDFVNHRYDVLVTTTIIESGLDFPRANTIFINRAEMFGLAQLYQLKGRVGRANLQAYAYLLVPGKSLIAREAEKRLAALMELSKLGSGFRLAAHDLEIRGTGNLLGTAQSGHMKAVGLELYMEMLSKAIAELKGEEVKEEIEPTVSLGITAYIPDDYVEDVNTRLVIYRRMSAAPSPRGLWEMEKELSDRFGPVPPIVMTLLKVMEIRWLLKQVLATSARRVGDEVRVEFREDTPVSLERIMKLKDEWGRTLKLSQRREVIIVVGGIKSDELLARVNKLLRELGAGDSMKK